MSSYDNQQCVSIEADADLSSAQFHFVSLSSDGQAALTGDGAAAVGVVQNDPDAAGKVAEVAISGIVKVECGGTVTAGGFVASNASGEAVDATSGDAINGEALEGGADGEIVRIVLKYLGTG